MGSTVVDIRAERDGFGRVAMGLGYVSEVHLTEALLVQREAQRVGFRKKLGTVLVDLGHMSEAQRQAVLLRQNLTPVAVRIGGFEIIGKLGAGAMGTVFKARQISLDRVVALKVLRVGLAQDPSIRERFLAEARAVARLNHPNIVSGISVGCSDGQYYFAMEYVDGESLADKLQTHRDGLPERKAVEYIRQVALAVQHAHNRRLLHRDIKPENILVTREDQTKLTDLGLAQALGQAGDPRITRDGVTVGTPHYLSPEQAYGTQKLTRATDLYALGATLYHILTGKVPYDGSTCMNVIVKHISDPVPDPRRVRAGLSLAISSICMKLMQKDPRSRYPSAVRLAEDLERVLERKPIRHAALMPFPKRRSDPVDPSGQGERHASPRKARLTGAKGIEYIFSSIAKRLGL